MNADVAAGSRAVTVNLKTGIGQVDRDREVLCVRMRGHKDHLYRSPMDTKHKMTVTFTKSVRVRARVTRDLASAVSFCESQRFELVLHACLIHMKQRGVVIDIGDAPDKRFEPPEGGYSPSWSIGCVLHKMITGRAPATLLDVENRKEMQALVRCLGAPSLSDSLAFGIPALDRPARFSRPKKVSGACFAERIVLRETLAWDPASRMRCTARGLVSAMDTIREEDKADSPA